MIIPVIAMGMFLLPLYGIHKEEEMKDPRHIIIHIPHDGNDFPEELMRSVCVPREEFLKYHREMRDSGCSSFVPEGLGRNLSLINFDISRLLCDVERFLGPEEIMEQYGMGYCYERAYDGKRIKKITPELKAAALVYYREHHARLDALARQYPRVLLIDLHSFSEKILPPGRQTEAPLPDICIGTDEQYTRELLADETERIFRDAGFSVTRNYPYTGTMVPSALLKGETVCDLISVMIEINKAAYMDNAGGVYAETQRRIREAIGDVIRAAQQT